MHFSPLTIGVTAFFILARIAAASSDYVVDAAPANGENSFVSHHHRHRLTGDRYPSKEKRSWSGIGNQAAATKKAQANALRTKLRQLEAPRPPPTAFRAANNRGKVLFGRALEKSHSKGVKVNYGNQAQLEKQNRAIGARVDEAWREQQSLQNALSGTSGAASVHLAQRNAKIANLFKQLHELYQQPLFSSNSYSAIEVPAKALRRRSAKLSAAQISNILSLLDSGIAASRVASMTGVNISTVLQIRSKHRPSNNKRH